MWPEKKALSVIAKDTAFGYEELLLCKKLCVFAYYTHVQIDKDHTEETELH